MLYRRDWMNQSVLMTIGDNPRHPNPDRLSILSRNQGTPFCLPVSSSPIAAFAS
jgi:hypothetical protein